MRKALALATASALLAGCGGGESGGALTAQEERELRETARMLDENVVHIAPDNLAFEEPEAEAVAEETP